MKNAIEYLKIIGALDENENLTILGGKRDLTIPEFEFMHIFCLHLLQMLRFFFPPLNNKTHAASLLTGRYLTMLPVEPKLGKMLLVGCIFNCLDPVLTVVSGLSVRDPFLTPFDKKDVSKLCKFILCRNIAFSESPRVRFGHALVFSKGPKLAIDLLSLHLKAMKTNQYH